LIAAYPHQVKKLVQECVIFMKKYGLCASSQHRSRGGSGRFMEAVGNDSTPDSTTG